MRDATHKYKPLFGLGATSTGSRIDVRLPCHRSLPLSTFAAREVRIEGRVIDPSRMKFELQGQAHSPADMAGQVDQVCFVLDST